MVDTYGFGRLTHTDADARLIYNSNPVKDSVDTTINQTMGEPGSNWQFTIKNFTKSSVVLMASLRSDPIVVPSVRDERQLFASTNNDTVLIEIMHTQITRGPKGTNQTVVNTTTKIKIPGHMLQSNSLFIHELGFYVTIASRVEATMALIAQDSHNAQAPEVSVPASMVKPDPQNTFQDFEALVKNSVERAALIQVRVGVDVSKPPAMIPDHVRDMRIAVYDRDFSPYANNRMVYDPHLDPDVFLVENLHFNPSEPFVARFSQLHNSDSGAFFIDHQERLTLKGDYCALAIFAGMDAFSDYVFSRKTQEIYEELQTRLNTTHANPMLRSKVERLEGAYQELQTRHDTNIEEVKASRAKIKELYGTIRERERTIDQLKDHHEVKMSAETIAGQMGNERLQTMAETYELELKQRMAQLNQQSTTWKSVSEIVKSSWGIVLALVGVGASIYKWSR